MSAQCNVRVYDFKNLMARLTSPTWAVIEHGKNYIFIPTSYVSKGKF